MGFYSIPLLNIFLYKSFIKNTTPHVQMRNPLKNQTAL